MGKLRPQWLDVGEGAARRRIAYLQQKPLRGDGPGKTMFVAQAANTGAVISFGGGDWPPPPANVPITAGASKNSATITVDSTSMTGAHPAFTMDGFLRIEASNNPPVCPPAVHIASLIVYAIAFDRIGNVINIRSVRVALALS